MIPYILIFLSAMLITSVAQTMLKISAMRVHKNRLREYLNPLLIGAYALFSATNVLILIAYKKVPLSMGPIIQATGYIFITILGKLFLHEKVTLQKICGLAVILIGIAMFVFGGYLFDIRIL